MCKAFGTILLIHIMAISSVVFGKSDFPIEVKDGRSPKEFATQFKHYGRSVQSGLAEEGRRYFRMNGSGVNGDTCGNKRGENYFRLVEHTAGIGKMAFDPRKQLHLEITCRVVDAHNVSNAMAQGLTVYYGGLDDGTASSYMHRMTFCSKGDRKWVDLSGNKQISLDWTKWHTFTMDLSPAHPDRTSVVIKDVRGKPVAQVENLQTFQRVYPYSDILLGDGLTNSSEIVLDVSYLKIDQPGKPVDLAEVRGAPKKQGRFGPKPPEFIVMDGTSQFFIDDYLIKEMEGLKRFANRAKKYRGNPVVRCEEPWEYSRIQLPVIFKEQGRYRMWYYSHAIWESRQPDSKVPTLDNSFILYAESEDGIHWTKPQLGMNSFKGSKENNIVLKKQPHEADFISIAALLKPAWQADLKKKNRLIIWKSTYPYTGGYKKLGFTNPPGFYLYDSPDGLHFQQTQADPIVYLYATDRKFSWQMTGMDATTFIVDNQRKKYVAFLKSSYLGKRARHLTQSKDLIHWDRPELSLYADRYDPQETEIYRNNAFPYESIWLGMATLFYPGKAETQDIQIIYSRDCKKWYRSSVREPIIPHGNKGAWDSQQIRACSTPVEMGDELWFYYSGINATHITGVLHPEETKSQIGLCTVKKDRFIALQAKKHGRVTTNNLQVFGDQLYVNCVTEGSLKVEVLDEDGKHIKGMSTEECQPITGDRIDVEVQWKSGKDFKSLSGKIVRLRFLLEHGKLYSFKMK